MEKKQGQQSMGDTFYLAYSQKINHYLLYISSCDKFETLSLCKRIEHNIR